MAADADIIRATSRPRTSDQNLAEGSKGFGCDYGDWFCWDSGGRRSVDVDDKYFEGEFITLIVLLSMVSKS